MTFSKNCLFVIIFSFLSLRPFCQTTISGTVTELKGGTLPGANVYLQGTFDGISTNAEGKFSFKTSKTGMFFLVVEFMGYEPFSKEIELKGHPIKLDVRLKEAFNRLNAVTITAGTFEAGDKKQSVVLSSLDMVTTAGAMGDVYGALQSLPGTSTNGESGRLFVKGGDSEESHTFIDGSLVYAPYSSSAPNMAVRGRFNPFMFKGTIFSTGGYSAEYGQALSSVLLLSTNDIPAKEQLDFSVMSIGAEMDGTKLWKTGALTGSLSYNNLQPYMNLVSQNYSWVKAPEAGSGALSIRQKTGKSGLLKAYCSFDNSRFAVMQEDLDQEKFIEYALKNDNYFANASWKSNLGTKWTVASGASFTRNTDNVDFEKIKFTMRLQGTHLKTVFSNLISEKMTLKFGAELFSKNYCQKYDTSSGYVANDFSNNTFSGFAEAEIYASAKFVARIGWRIEYSDYLKQGNISPRISAAYKLNATSQFSMAYGWFYQTPADEYLLFTHSLQYERADHYTFSFQSSKDDRTFRAEFYYKDYSGLVKTNSEPIYMPSRYSNDGDGYARGLDIFWRDKKSIRHGDYWVSYSFIDTRRDYKNYPCEAIPTFVSKHNFSVVYKHWFGGWRSLAGINFKYSSPRYFNNPNTSEFNNARTLPYRSLDVSWSFLYKQNIIFFGAVSNILGFRQEFGNRYANERGADNMFKSAAIVPRSGRFYIVACFITLTRKGDTNQLDKIE